MDISEVCVIDGLTCTKWNNAPLTGNVTKYHPNGQRSLETRFCNGKMTMRTGWYENGRMVFQYTYANGNRLGE